MLTVLFDYHIHYKTNHKIGFRVAELIQITII
ncbi:hypothetical protein HNQ56_004835 [Anaerotaenia torta]